MNKVEEAITDYWGKRCPEHEDGCPACEAWKQYDQLVGAKPTKYVVERLLKFKTAPERWEPQSICDTLEEAETRVELFTRLLDANSRANGAQITAYRIKE